MLEEYYNLEKYCRKDFFDIYNNYTYVLDTQTNELTRYINDFENRLDLINGDISVLSGDLVYDPNSRIYEFVTALTQLPIYPYTIIIIWSNKKATGYIKPVYIDNTTRFIEFKRYYSINITNLDNIDTENIDTEFIEYLKTNELEIQGIGTLIPNNFYIAPSIFNTIIDSVSISNIHTVEFNTGRVGTDLISIFGNNNMIKHFNYLLSDISYSLFNNENFIGIRSMNITLINGLSTLINGESGYNNYDYNININASNVHLCNTLLKNGKINAVIDFSNSKKLSTKNISYLVDNLAGSDIYITASNSFENTNLISTVINNISETNISMISIGNVNAENIGKDIINSSIFLQNTSYIGNGDNAFENVENTTIIASNCTINNYNYTVSNGTNPNLIGFLNTKSCSILYTNGKYFDNYVVNGNSLENSYVMLPSYVTSTSVTELCQNTSFNILSANVSNVNDRVIIANNNTYNGIVNAINVNNLYVGDTTIQLLNVSDCNGLQLVNSSINELQNYNKQGSKFSTMTTSIVDYIEKFNNISYVNNIFVNDNIEIIFNGYDEIYNFPRLYTQRGQFKVNNINTILISNVSNYVLTDDINVDILKVILKNASSVIIGSKFTNSSNILNIMLPSYVNMVYDYAFSGLTISDLRLDYATNISYNSLLDISRTKQINLSSCVNEPFDLEIFRSVSNIIETLNLNSVKSISGSLIDFENLNTIVLGSLEHIGDNMFRSSNIENIIITGDNVKTIGNHAFAYSNISTVQNFHNAVSIGDYAFAYCNNISYVINPFGSNVSYGSNVFEGCKNISDVALDNLNSIPVSMFKGCPNITNFTYNGNIETNCSVIGIINDSSMNFINYTNNFDKYCIYDFTTNYPNISTITLENVTNGLAEYICVSGYKYVINGKNCEFKQPLKQAVVTNSYATYRVFNYIDTYYRKFSSSMISYNIKNNTSISNHKYNESIIPINDNEVCVYNNKIKHRLYSRIAHSQSSLYGINFTMNFNEVNMKMDLIDIDNNVVKTIDNSTNTDYRIQYIYRFQISYNSSVILKEYEYTSIPFGTDIDYPFTVNICNSRIFIPQVTISYNGFTTKTVLSDRIPINESILSYDVNTVFNNINVNNLSYLNTFNAKNMVVISDNMFENDNNLSTVNVSNNIAKIGNYAFYNTKLNKNSTDSIINSINTSVIGNYAFAKSLDQDVTSLFINISNVSSVGTFSANPYLSTINASLQTIVPNMFYGCITLNNGTLSCENINVFGFGNCNISILTTSNMQNCLYTPSLINISTNAFSRNYSLKTIYLTNSGTNIEPDGFNSCSYIDNVIINANANSCLNGFGDKINISSFTSISNLSIANISNILQNSTKSLTNLTIYGDNLKFNNT